MPRFSQPSDIAYVHVRTIKTYLISSLASPNHDTVNHEFRTVRCNLSQIVYLGVEIKVSTQFNAKREVLFPIQGIIVYFTQFSLCTLDKLCENLAQNQFLELSIESWLLPA